MTPPSVGVFGVVDGCCKRIIVAIDVGIIGVGVVGVGVSVVVCCKGVFVVIDCGVVGFGVDVG